MVNLMRKFLLKFYKDSGIHGVAYGVRRKLNRLERYFWLIMVILCFMAVIVLCKNELVRFENRAIVNSLERNYQSWKFPKFGVTICANYSNHHDNEGIVFKYWAIDRNHSKFDYYMEFLNDFGELNYGNLEILKRYNQDETLLKLNLRELALDIKENMDFGKNSDQSLTNFSVYAKVITEMGVCVSSTQINRFQNPTGQIVTVPISAVLWCRHFEDCITTLIPPSMQYVRNLKFFFHSVYDLMVTNTADSVSHELIGDVTANFLFAVDELVAEHEVRKLPIFSRKCYFYDETSLSYFNITTRALCRMECRIKAAIRFCKCKPYFYVVGPATPICDLNGLVCLAGVNWYNATCNCLKPCEVVRYLPIGPVTIDNNAFFQKSIIVNSIMPKTRMKIIVVYSLDQLIVSIGGIASFFMGFNLINFIEILYFLIEVLGTALALKVANFRQ